MKTEKEQLEWCEKYWKEREAKRWDNIVNNFDFDWDIEVPEVIKQDIQNVSNNWDAIANKNVKIEKQKAKYIYAPSKSFFDKILNAVFFEK